MKIHVWNMEGSKETITTLNAGLIYLPHEPILEAYTRILKTYEKNYLVKQTKEGTDRLSFTTTFCSLKNVFTSYRMTQYSIIFTSLVVNTRHHFLQVVRHA